MNFSLEDIHIMKVWLLYVCTEEHYIYGLSNMSDEKVIEAINKEYEGGLPAFLAQKDDPCSLDHSLIKEFIKSDEETDDLSDVSKLKWYVDKIQDLHRKAYEQGSSEEHRLYQNFAMAHITKLMDIIINMEEE